MVSLWKYRGWKEALIVLMVLLTLYVGAYCWMVVPLPLYGLSGSALPASQAIVVPIYDPPFFPLQGAGGWIGSILAPVHSLDRRIRPHVWEPTP